MLLVLSLLLVSSSITAFFIPGDYPQYLYVEYPDIVSTEKRSPALTWTNRAKINTWVHPAMERYPNLNNEYIDA